MTKRKSKRQRVADAMARYGETQLHPMTGDVGIGHNGCLYVYNGQIWITTSANGPLYAAQEAVTPMRFG